MYCSLSRTRLSGVIIRNALGELSSHHGTECLRFTSVSLGKNLNPSSIDK